jgi:NADPH:quinone reductase-like Zn-dependent oxidoreductase
MKVAIFEKYGQPDVLELREVAKPVPGDHEILVRIFSTAVNSGDVRMRKADPFAMRFLVGLFKPRINVLGGVFSGRVEAIGKKVTRYRVGDEVFGSTDMKFGAYAEYKCFPEEGTLALKPGNISHDEAAVIPFGGATALYFLKKANIKPGQKVLIYGASGAVGTAAVQLAKYFGAEVTGVCSTGNMQLVKSLGADHVIDYKKQNWQDGPERYDVIYDTVNKISINGSLQKLTPHGTLILGAAMLSEMLSGLVQGMWNRKKVLFGVISQTAADIRFLGDLVEKGELKPVIDKTYAFEEIVAAHTYVDKGHKRGNIAIALG